MSNDIVNQLREGYGQGCKCFAHCYCECSCDAIWAGHYISEAADEIERLRASNAEMSAIAADFARWVNHIKMEHNSMYPRNVPHSEFELKRVVQRYNKAARGE